MSSLAKNIQELKDSESSSNKTTVDKSHYEQLNIEPIDYSMANSFNPMQFTIIKYVSRYNLKHDDVLIDLYKARQTLDMLIEREKNSMYRANK